MQSYTLPEARHLAAAANRAQDLRDTGTNSPELARLASLILAAIVRDAVTGFDHRAPFDAVSLELAPGGRAGTVEATGTYWTAADEPRQLTEDDVYELSDWTRCLTAGNRAGWAPLCRTAAGAPTHNRLDLRRAAEPVAFA